MAIENVLTQSSTIILRAVSYFFLRWGLLPPLAPIAFTAFVIYIPAAISSFLYTLQNGQEEEVIETRTARTRQFTEVDGVVLEETDVTDTETVLDTSRAVSLWKTILTGVPNPRNLVLTLLTFLINLACVTMVADRTTGIYTAAVEPWHNYHTSVNPPAVRRSDSTVAKTGVTWFEFAQGPANFFMADTRSYRSSNKINYEDEDKSMLGAEQLADLIAFLQKPEPKGIDWKIIASSVPFTKNWPVNVQDTWGGFLVERQKILEEMWDVAARGIGVVVLSGDRHEFAATKFPPPKDSKWAEEATVYEFSASPLSQFYSPIGTYRQSDNEDVEIKYINKGYSKFGAITVEKVPESDKSSLSYRLFVDGVEAWNTTVLSPDRTVLSKFSTANLWDRFTGSR